MEFIKLSNSTFLIIIRIRIRKKNVFEKMKRIGI
jgi:hypothetical protein